MDCSKDARRVRRIARQTGSLANHPDDRRAPACGCGRAPERPQVPRAAAASSACGGPPARDPWARCPAADFRHRRRRAATRPEKARVRAPSRCGRRAPHDAVASAGGGGELLRAEGSWPCKASAAARASSSCCARRRRSRQVWICGGGGRLRLGSAVRCAVIKQPSL